MARAYSAVLYPRHGWLMPKITLLFASLHALMLLVLAARVALYRHAQKVGMGDGGDKYLARRIRVHANFVEYVPMGLVLMGLLELSGVAAVVLWICGAAMLLARVLHAIGLTRKSGVSFGRRWGTLLTWLTLAAMAVLGLWRSFAAM